MKYSIFITAREQSSRLNKKCLKSFGDNITVLEWVTKRVQSNKELIPIICTGDAANNKNILRFACKNKILCFSGPENNKIKRWFECARKLNITKFHALDCDDPFFDPKRLILSMNMLTDKDAEVILPSSYSDNGAATEGFSIKTDSLSFSSDLSDSSDTEMCYSFFKENLRSYEIYDPQYKGKKIRLTLDYEEDYKFLYELSRKFRFDTQRYLIEDYIKQNFTETPNYKLNTTWKNNQSAITKGTYENFSRTK